MKAARVVLVIVAVFATVYGLGDDTFSADLCSDPVLLFNNTSRVLPGSQVKITCSVLGNGMLWNSSHFAGPVVVDTSVTSNMELNGNFMVMFDVFEAVPAGFCSTTTATITSVHESMDGLDLTCQSVTSNGSSSTVIDVIDPPGPVNFAVQQYCNEINISWAYLLDDPCPIIGYNITIAGSTVPLDGNVTAYTHPVSDDDCENTLPISMFAINAAGTGKITYENITIYCTPTDLSLCAVVSITRNSRDNFLAAYWKNVPLNGVEALLFQVDSPSSVTMNPLNLDNTMHMYSIPPSLTFPRTFNVIVSSEDPNNEMCFSTSDQITFPALMVTNQTNISDTEATITLTINSTFVEVTDDNLELSPNSDGSMCVIGEQSTQSLRVDCNGLSEETPYSLTVNMSVGGNNTCVMININFETTPPTSTEPTGVTGSPITPPSDANLVLIVGVVVAVVVVGLLTLVVILIIVIRCIKKKSRLVSLGGEKEDSDAPVALVEKTNPQTGEIATYENPADVQHKTSPAGDMYAVVDKQQSRRAAPSTPAAEPTTYQDPDTIKRQTAPTGDLYALPQSKQSKPVYAEVNKPTEGMMYADLALTGAGQGGSNRPPNSQEARPVYSEILHPKPSSPTGQDDSVDIPLEECLYEKH